MSSSVVDRDEDYALAAPRIDDLPSPDRRMICTILTPWGGARLPVTRRPDGRSAPRPELSDQTRGEEG